jgi:hypothetical protein
VICSATWCTRRCLTPKISAIMLQSIRLVYHSVYITTDHVIAATLSGHSCFCRARRARKASS